MSQLELNFTRIKNLTQVERIGNPAGDASEFVWRTDYTYNFIVNIILASLLLSKYSLSYAIPEFTRISLASLTQLYLADGGEAAVAGLQAGHGPPVVHRVERLVVVHDLGLVGGHGVDDVVEGGGVHRGLLEELPLQQVRAHV